MGACQGARQRRDKSHSRQGTAHVKCSGAEEATSGEHCVFCSQKVLVLAPVLGVG